MPLQRRSITIPVVGSADERSDPKQVNPPKLTTLDNVDLSETGAIKKRRPFEGVSGGRWPLRDPSRRLLLTDDYTVAEEHSALAALGREAYLGKQCQLTRKDLRGDGDQWYTDYHAAEGFDGSLWVGFSRYTGSSNGYTWEFGRYTADGEPVFTGVTATSPGSSEYVRLMPWFDGTDYGVWAVYLDGSDLYALKFTNAGAAQGSAVALASDAEAFDVCQQDGAAGFVTSTTTLDTNTVTKQLDLTAVDGGPPTTLDTWAKVGNLISCAFITPANDVMVAVLAIGAGGGLEVRNATVGAAVTVNASATPSNSFHLSIGQHENNQALVAYTWFVSNSPYAQLEVVTTTPSLGSNHSVSTMSVAGKAQRTTHGTYLPLLRQPQPPGNPYLEARGYHLVRIGGPDEGGDLQAWPVAHYGYDLGFLPSSRTMPPLVKLDDDTLAIVAAKVVVAQTFGGAARTLTGATLWKFDFRRRRNYNTASIAGLTVIAGAAPTFYDGRDIQMLGHPSAPTIKDITADTGGSLTAESTYTYIAVYEFRDAAGRVWRSTPSVPVSITLGVGEDETEVTVYSAINRIHPDDSYQVQIALYRNTQDTPTIYYRATDPAPTTDTTEFNQDWNDPAAPAHLFIADTASDAAIAANEILYTVGGVLENHPPPPLVAVCEHRNRLFGIHAETGDIWATKEYVPGEGLHFTSTHVTSNPVEGEVGTALASTESALLVFYQSRIGQIFGDGPNDLGQGAWSQIEFLPSDTVGAISQRAVSPLPQGVLVIDPNSGPHLMPYGGAPQRIGQDLPIVSYSPDSVIGIDYLEDRDEVRLTFSSGGYRAWHPGLNAWTTGQVRGGVLSAELTAVWDGAHAVGFAAGGVSTVQLETTDTDYDEFPGNVAPILTIETAWIKLAQLPGIQGRFRLWDVYLIGEYVDTHNLTVRLAYDFDDSDTYEVSFADADLSVLTPYQLRVQPSKQNIQAVKIYVSEWKTGEGGPEAGATTGAFKLSQIRLDFGIPPRGGRPWIKQSARV